MLRPYTAHLSRSFGSASLNSFKLKRGLADTDVEVRVSKSGSPFDRQDAEIKPLANAGGANALNDTKPDPADRRHAPRYRFSEPMKVCCQDGACLDGISVEISLRGMSAVVRGVLRPGDVVRLQPVTGVVTSAVVRHKLGMLYGFEFLELPNEQAGKIAERCRECEPWRSNARSV